MANMLRSAQQTRNSHIHTHKEKDTPNSATQMAEELPLQYKRETGNTDSSYIMLGCMMWRAALVTAAAFTKQMQRRAAPKGVDIYSGQCNVQRCLK